MNQELDHQMLILWMNLSDAAKAYAVKNEVAYSTVEPWNCDAAEVKNVWMEITAPQHLPYLEESLASLQNMIIDPPNLTIHTRTAARRDCFMGFVGLCIQKRLRRRAGYMSDFS